MSNETPTPLSGPDLRFGACFARLEGDQFVAGNELIERRWQIRNGLLYATSIRDLTTGREWLGEPSRLPAPYPDIPVPDEPRHLTLSGQCGRLSPVEAPSLLAELAAAGAQMTLAYRLRLFAGVAGIAMQLDVRTEGTAGEALATADTDLPAPDSLEQVTLAPEHLRLAQAQLVDQSDHHNEMLFEREWLLHPAEMAFALDGDVFTLQETLSRSGLVMLKHAPLPHSRPCKPACDLRAIAKPHRFAFYGHGLGGEAGAGYWWITLAYNGGEVGRTVALQAYQRALRTYRPERDGLLLSNTWGDGSRDSRIQEAFIEREIEAAARLGVDVVQVDDGWERGRTINSVQGGIWQGYWAGDPRFWEPDPERFPRGFAPLVKQAGERGLRFGLWFSPDSADDFANWQRDADLLLGIHRSLDVDYFKIDGVKARTKAGERNLHRFFDRVLHESAGRIVLDLDVTAEVRPGYFGRADLGPLFVENRYHHAHRYWPHQTLRNLWKIAHYVDPLRLRMEVLNNSLSAELYTGDPLAPMAYRADYLFATVMFSSPLGWFEVSNLPEAYIRQAAPLVAIWKAHRARLFAGRLLPIGETPDGTAWTGFASIGDGEGYVLLFRELNDRPHWQTDAAFFGGGRYEVEVLAGEGKLVLAEGQLAAEIGEAQRFLFARIQRA